MQQQEEIFLPIKDFPGYYVSNLGRVYSARSEKNKTTSILRPGTDKKGYLMVSLCKDGKPCPKKVHRLVAEAFIPNPDNLETVNHLDEDKTNNSVDNLEWCSRGDNSRYSCSRPVMDIKTGAIYTSTVEASKAMHAPDNAIANSLYNRNGKYRGHKFIYLAKATDESVNTIELFGKKYEIPEICKCR